MIYIFRTIIEFPGGSLYAVENLSARNSVIFLFLTYRTGTLMRCGAGLSAEWTHSPGHHFEWQRADSGAASQPSRSAVAMEHGIGRPKRSARPLGLSAHHHQ